jgi:Domain of unknown function (DUF4760)
MNAEWLTAIATAGTFVVIAASAGAALVQLRHMRASNQIVALMEIRETLESPHFEAAANYVLRDFRRRLEDPQVRKVIVTPGPAPDELLPVRKVCNFMETFGSLVKNGIIDRKIACDLFGYVVLQNWEVVAPFVVNRRAALNNPSLYENFEYLAATSKAWYDAHPAGSYPAHTARMAHPDLWPELKDRKERI